MRPLPLLRGEKLSTSSHSSFFRLIPSDPIEKHRPPLCGTKGRKADRASAIFRFWLFVVIQSARSVPLPPPRYWSSKRMNEPKSLGYREWGTALSRFGHGKKGQPAGFHVSSDPANGNTSVPLSARDFESARELGVLSYGSLAPLTTFYLKFNLK